MKDAYYFPHDVNAIQDPKMMCLLSECGLEGVGIYWIIIEILHQQPEGLIGESDLELYIKFYSNKNEQVLNKIKQALFASLLLFNDGGKVGSYRVLDNKKYRDTISAKRSLAGKISAQTRSKQTHVEHMSTLVEQNPTKERKGKEKKVYNDHASQLLTNQKKSFEIAWGLYPNKRGKQKSFSIYCKTVLNPTQARQCQRAVENYLEEIEDKGTAEQYIKHGSTFFNMWLDYYELKPFEDEENGLHTAIDTADAVGV